MDIISHAIAGAAVGFHYGSPIVGALVGIAPDCVLSIKRLHYPTNLYNHTHSIIPLVILGIYDYFYTTQPIVFFALLSHIILDLPTHGKIWAPALFYPYSKKRYSFGDEWEWFSTSWFTGLIITIIWSFIWINL